MLGTLAATYLQRRGITRLGPALLYHPRVFLWQGEHDTDPPQGFTATDTASRLSLVYAIGG